MPPKTKPATADEIAQDEAIERLTAPAGVVVLVAAPGGPRRRAGLAFGPVATPVSVDALDETQWKAILNDPHLSVRAAKDAVAEDAVADEPTSA